MAAEMEMELPELGRTITPKHTVALKYLLVHQVFIGISALLVIAALLTPLPALCFLFLHPPRVLKVILTPKVHRRPRFCQMWDSHR